MARAKKSLGQNFLKDNSIVKKIMDAAEIQKTDHLVEIGPGEGFLTRALLEKTAHLTAIELDNDLIPFLKIEFGRREGFELLHEDALKFIAPSTPYKVVANIPYYITSPLLNHFLYDQFLNGNPPKMLVLMVQKEVAEKIISKDGKQSMLSLEVQLFGKASLVCTVPREAFRPAPKVESAVIKIEVFDEPVIACDLPKLFQLFKQGFSEKRKKLINNLARNQYGSAEVLRELFARLEINPDIRAERLGFEDWKKLFEALKA